MKLNKLRSNKSGFTLLEIIIVIIIVGVLASVALPKLFSTVGFSESAEAMNSMGVVRKSVERCRLVRNDVATACGVWTALDVPDPGLPATAKFTYTVTIGAPKEYAVVATSKAAGADTITLSVNDTTPGSETMTIIGAGKFSAISQ